MKMLLKDPNLVDAVIKKITDKYPCYENSFVVYCVPIIKEELADGCKIVLNVDFYYNNRLRAVASTLDYDVVTLLPTDQDFLNDKEW